MFDAERGCDIIHKILIYLDTEEEVDGVTNQQLVSNVFRNNVIPFDVGGHIHEFNSCF
jgi:hypothetical protein